MSLVIEADIKDGQLVGGELDKLPRQAHVLITLLDSEGSKRPTFGEKTSAHIELAPDAFSPMSDEELADWGM